MCQLRNSEAITVTLITDWPYETSQAIRTSASIYFGNMLDAERERHSILAVWCAFCRMFLGNPLSGRGPLSAGVVAQVWVGVGVLKGGNGYSGEQGGRAGGRRVKLGGVARGGRRGKKRKQGASRPER